MSLAAAELPLSHPSETIGSRLHAAQSGMSTPIPPLEGNGTACPGVQNRSDAIHAKGKRSQKTTNELVCYLTAAPVKPSSSAPIDDKASPRLRSAAAFLFSGSRLRPFWIAARQL
ncbi:hypothetical protein ILFOPFJJ_05892 [Ensifer psoraleae]|nr:hypothetical protein [Sinorhizobium psoraleae]